MNPTTRVFLGFFSVANDKTFGGKGTREYEDIRTGDIVKVNFIGEWLDGKPAFVDDDGRIVRPPNLDSYVFVGEIGVGRLQPTEAPQRLSFSVRPSPWRAPHISRGLAELDC